VCKEQSNSMEHSYLCRTHDDNDEMLRDGLRVHRELLRLKEDDILRPFARHDLNRDLITRMALAEIRLLLATNILERPLFDKRLVSRTAGIELSHTSN
jgi:hypothetical protein